MPVCDNCGDEYKNRSVFITKGNLQDWVERRERFEHLCEDCEDEYWDGDTNGFDQ